MKKCKCFIKNSLMIVLLSSTYLHSQVSNLIQRWENRDGAQFIELGFEISKSLIEDDTLFFNVMSNNTKVFSSWVDNLQSSPFTAYEAGNDKIEMILYKSYYIKLKELMIIHTKKFLNDMRYRTLARILYNKLKHVYVRFID